MKALFALSMLLPTVTLAAPAQDPKTACLYVPDLRQSEIIDDSTVLYHMRDHSVYRINMLTRCNGLKQEPDGFTFIQDSLATENLCANQATIRLNSFRTICQFGNITRVK